MRSRARGTLVLAASLCSGCGDEDPGSKPTVEPTGCEAPAVELPDGACWRPGVPEDGCGTGFVHDGEYGCEPVLPIESCPPGLMAVPGESECRAIMACGDGPWGEIPVDATTVYVDGSFTGGGSDGSEAQPFTTIGDAVAAATPGALIAVAEGSYVESVTVQGKPVRLWGRCPEKVEVVGVGGQIGTLVLLSGADGSEVRGLAITGAGVGVGLSGIEGVVLDHLWVHGNDLYGVDAEDDLGLVSFQLTGSLVEGNVGHGVMVLGSTSHVERSVVRSTVPSPAEAESGNGLKIQMSCDPQGNCNPDAPSTVTIVGSVIEDNQTDGIFAGGSHLTVEQTVVRTTRPSDVDAAGGNGIAVEPCGPYKGCATLAPATLVVRSSVVAANHDVGIVVRGAQASVERSVVRPTDQTVGRGIFVQHLCYAPGHCEPATRGAATLQESLVEQCHQTAVVVSGADLQVASSVIRTTWPRASDQRFGRGFSIQSCDGTEGCSPLERSTVTIDGSLIDGQYEFGLLALDSDLVMNGTVVRGTLAHQFDGLFGDGVAVAAEHSTATGSVTGSLIDDTARAGVGSFGASVALTGSHVRCAAIELNGQDHGGNDYAFNDGGNNACGCPAADHACQVATADLEPPQPLGP